VKERSDPGRESVLRPWIKAEISVAGASVQLQVATGLAVKKEKRGWQPGQEKFFLDIPFHRTNVAPEFFYVLRTHTEESSKKSAFIDFKGLTILVA
jgi:hypothetical protein